MQIGHVTAEPSAPSAAAAPARYDGFGRMPIAGSWRQGRSGQVAADHDPYSGETLLEIPLADVRDVDEAYRAAAARQPRWAATVPQERRDVLERAVRIAEARREEIVDWLVKETGSTTTTARVEWDLFRDQLAEHATFPFHAAGRIIPTAIPGKESRVYRLPVGVVCVIGTWSFPLHVAARSVGPALAVGNAVVLKPASGTPVTGGLLLAKILEEAGLPEGVLSVVVGAGKDIGDCLLDHPIPRVVSFTGTTAVGRHVGERCGVSLKRVYLELGGNAPFVVLDDADLDLAVAAAVAGKFVHQGQACGAINRIVVDAKVHDAFVERFTKRVMALRAGDPSDARTAIGPIIDRRRLDAVLRKVDETIAAGASVVVRGQISGLVLSPIVLTDVTNEMPAARDEVFGPVAPIVRADGEDEAIRIANDTEYGLSSAVFTRDVDRGVRVAHRIQVGMTHVNDWPLNEEANAPFGGEKASGIGRFGGQWGLDAVTTQRWVSIQATPRRYPI